MSKPKSLGVIALIALPSLFFGFILAFPLLLLAPAPQAVADCGPSVAVPLNGAKVEGFTDEQLKNAAAIIGAGKTLTLSAQGQAIGVMVALGESGLRVLDYGDTAGPDSRGLFQQRDNGAWGSYDDRMNPTISSTNFFKALTAVPDWELLEPTIAGNAVQRNADAYHYVPYWPSAVKIVQALSDTDGCLVVPGSSGAGDDYPWPDAPTWVQVGVGPASTSPLGMYYRECVDFALWRVNQQMGSTSVPFKYLNGTFRPDGFTMGSANTWKDAWDAKGWPTGSVPRVGAVVWYEPGAPGADPYYGHVAVVLEVKDDGTFIEEGYNGNPAPDDHNYYTRSIKTNAPTAFLYLPVQEEKK